jgi:sulfur-oxidizing protein SoxX
VASLFAATSFAEGDPGRGRAIVANRHVGMCLLCHRAPIPEERFQGDLAPDLAGVGVRLSREELRARVVDSRRANARTIMPAYLSTEGLTRVAPAFRGKTIFSEEQVQDVVAYLATLK